jgi:signal peptidase II
MKFFSSDKFKFKISKESFILFLVTFFVVVLDQLSKWLVDIYYLRPTSILGPIMQFNNIHNKGGGFGILEGQLWLFIVFAVFAIVFILYFKDRFELKLKFAFFVLIGGIIGNLVDRVWFGYVRDFIDFHFWPVFNLADVFIVLSVGYIVYYIFRYDVDYVEKEGSNE